MYIYIYIYIFLLFVENTKGMPNMKIEISFSLTFLFSTAEQRNIQTPIRTQYMQPHHHRINHTPTYFNGLF